IAELTVKDLALMRGGRMLQAEITFCLSAGETLSVCGPNGAGKTSLLRALAGMLDVPCGCIVFRTYRHGIVANAEERIARIGWLGHQDGVKGQLTLLEILRTHSENDSGAGNTEGALASLGLSHLRHLPAQYLSHGQRR